VWLVLAGGLAARYAEVGECAFTTEIGSAWISFLTAVEVFYKVFLHVIRPADDQKQPEVWPLGCRPSSAPPKVDSGRAGRRDGPASPCGITVW
jgi:hypothetical protein